MIFGTTLYMVQNIAFNNIAFSGNQQVFNTEHSKWTVLIRARQESYEK